MSDLKASLTAEADKMEALEKIAEHMTALAFHLDLRKRLLEAETKAMTARKWFADTRAVRRTCDLADVEYDGVMRRYRALEKK